MVESNSHIEEKNSELRMSLFLIPSSIFSSYRKSQKWWQSGILLAIVNDSGMGSWPINQSSPNKAYLGTFGWATYRQVLSFPLHLWGCEPVDIYLVMRESAKRQGEIGSPWVICVPGSNQAWSLCYLFMPILVAFSVIWNLNCLYSYSPHQRSLGTTHLRWQEFISLSSFSIEI